MPTKKTEDTKPATAKAPAKTAAATAAKKPARKASAAKPAAPRAAPKSAPRKKAATTVAAPKTAAKAKTPARKPAAKPTAKPQASTASKALGAFSIGAAVVAVGAAVVETVRRIRGHGEGHAAPDLALDHEREAGDRAPDAFRPDPTAAVPANEREALRPATLELGSGRELDSVH
jgi:hypothetical protein